MLNNDALNAQIDLFHQRTFQICLEAADDERIAASAGSPQHAASKPALDRYHRELDS